MQKVLQGVLGVVVVGLHFGRGIQLEARQGPLDVWEIREGMVQFQVLLVVSRLGHLVVLLRLVAHWV